MLTTLSPNRLPYSGADSGALSSCNVAIQTSVFPSGLIPEPTIVSPSAEIPVTWVRVHSQFRQPGRINDCLDMAYLVLNQCCYIVLDEADRMIDMGFAPQMESILDAMGGSIKSEDAEETYRDILDQGDISH